MAGWRRAWDRIDGRRNGWAVGLADRSVGDGWMVGHGGLYIVTACASACMRLFVCYLGS